MTTIIQEEFAALLDPGCVANSCHDNSTLTRQGGLVSKRCPKCKTEKPTDGFHKKSASRHGLQSWCLGCMKAKSAEYKRRLKQTHEGRSKQSEYNRRWRQTPKGRAKKSEYMRGWRKTPEARAKKSEYMRRRRQIDLQFRLAHTLRNRLHKALKGSVKSSRTIDLLGCTLEHLIHHIESRFQPGMSWLNQGEWHIDHIKPLKAFDLSDPEQQRMACHWSNLQPLWAADNIRKGAKYHQEATCLPACNALSSLKFSHQTRGKL